MATPVHCESTARSSRLGRMLAAGGETFVLEADLWPSCLDQVNRCLQQDQKEQARAILVDRGLEQVERLVQRRPELTDLMYLTARLLEDADLPEQAAAWYRRVVAREPHVEPLRRLGGLVDCVEAVDVFRQAHRLDPQDSEILWSYAQSLLNAGYIEEGVTQLEAAYARRPESEELLYGVLWHRHYLPGFDEAYFHREYCRWTPRFYRADAPVGPHRNDRRLDRRLRLGIVSGNFVDNSVMTPFEQIVRLFDRQAFEIWAYSNVVEPDVGTERWRDLVDGFRDIHTLDDRQAAQCVHEDGIDILLEVGGVCEGSRIGVFAYEPAPVQVDYGSLSTLGLPQVRYRFSCPVLDPPEQRAYYVEETIDLDPMCPYSPPSPSPLVRPLPALDNGFVTFGVFNNHRKINALCLDLWAEILRRLPDALLLLKFPGARDRALALSYVDRLAQRGVEPGRVRVCGMTSHMVHLDLLGHCDLILDTYPYNAARGTMEALWMGVPTVTWTGSTFVSREGLAIQRQVGLEVFAADSAEQYVEKAVAFAGQLDHLAAIRRALRGRMLGCRLCDPKGWTDQFQRALRRLWHRWAQSPTAPEATTHG